MPTEKITNIDGSGTMSIVPEPSTLIGMPTPDGSDKFVAEATNVTGTVAKASAGGKVEEHVPKPDRGADAIETPASTVVRSDAFSVFGAELTLITGPSAELPAKMYGIEVAVVASVKVRYELLTDNSNANAPMVTEDVPVLVSATSKSSGELPSTAILGGSIVTWIAAVAGRAAKTANAAKAKRTPNRQPCRTEVALHVIAVSPRKDVKSTGN